MGNAIIPNALLSDSRFVALSQIVNEAFALTPRSAVLVNLVDTVDGCVLPFLADQFQVRGEAGLLLASDDSYVRELIKQSISIHRHKGTRYAVEQALSAVGVRSHITEWFEQNPHGAPYTFLIDLLLTDAPEGQPVLTPERADAVLRMVRLWKPARSQFRARVGVSMATTTKSAAVIRPAQRCSLTFAKGMKTT